MGRDCQVSYPVVGQLMFTSGLVHSCCWDESISGFRGFVRCFHFYCILHRNSCMQPVLFCHSHYWQRKFFVKFSHLSLFYDNEQTGKKRPYAEFLL